MEILNTTTGEIEELIYAPTGCDCMGDLTADDASLTYNAETGVCEAEGSAIDWWRTWVAAQEELGTLWAAVREDFDEESAEEIRQAVEFAQGCCDMEDQPRAGKAAIMEWMQEHGYFTKVYDNGSVAFTADIVGLLKGVEPLVLEKEPDREF